MNGILSGDIVLSVGLLLLENLSRIAGLIMVFAGYMLLPKPNVRFVRIKVRKMLKCKF